jgi:hypothetical protein
MCGLAEVRQFQASIEPETHRDGAWQPVAHPTALALACSWPIAEQIDSRNFAELSSALRSIAELDLSGQSISVNDPTPNKVGQTRTSPPDPPVNRSTRHRFQPAA